MSPSKVMTNEKIDQHTEMLTSLVGSNVRVGDFALVQEHYLVEVLERATNSLGYFRYRVMYIADRPHPDVEQEWQPATDVHTLWEREKVESWWADQIAAASDAQRIEVGSWDQETLLRRYLNIIWKDRLRDEVLTKLCDLGPVAYS
jgi:hypothetical protein